MAAVNTRASRREVPVENTYFSDNTAAAQFAYAPQYGNAPPMSSQGLNMNVNGGQADRPAYNFGSQPGYYPPFDPNNPMMNSPVAAFAMNYATNLAGQQATAMQANLEKYVGVSRLKYYFFVDTSSVISKIRLLLFPFLNREWRTRFNSNKPVEPRHDLNAPDLYVPLMSYVTYLVLLGIRSGMRNEFSPEKLGALGSSSLALLVFEVLLCTVVQYVMSVQSDLRVFDLLAFTGYKFVPICVLLLMTLLLGASDGMGLGYMALLVYLCAATIYFLTRTLKYQLLRHVADDGQYGAAGAGHKRRGLFIVVFALFQALFVVYLAR